MSASTKRKSPLKTKPLRQAGESVSEQQRETVLDTGLIWLLVAIAGATSLSWWALQLLIEPALAQTSMLVLGFGAVGLGLWKVHSIKDTVERFRLGAQGERAVADVLNDLAGSGYRAVHDLQFDNFNVDHVLVGPSGIYVIETKTRSKANVRRNTVRFDGARVQFNDGPWTDDHVRQTKRQAQAIEELLRRYMAKASNVRPVLLYPGWWVEGPDQKAAIWVTNHDRFAGFVRKERNRLTNVEVRQIFESLATHQRVHDT